MRQGNDDDGKDKAEAREDLRRNRGETQTERAGETARHARRQLTAEHRAAVDHDDDDDDAATAADAANERSRCSGTDSGRRNGCRNGGVGGASAANRRSTGRIAQL